MKCMLRRCLVLLLAGFLAAAHGSDTVPSDPECPSAEGVDGTELESAPPKREPLSSSGSESLRGSCADAVNAGARSSSAGGGCFGCRSRTDLDFFSLLDLTGVVENPTPMSSPSSFW